MNTILIIAFALACALALSAAPATNTPAAAPKPAPSRARYSLTGEVTKLTNNIIAVTIGTGINAKPIAMRITPETKVLIEKPDTDKEPGKEGQIQPKIVPGKQSDLKLGQRVKVQYFANTANEILVLKPPAPKPKADPEKAPAK